MTRHAVPNCGAPRQRGTRPTMRPHAEPGKNGSMTPSTHPNADLQRALREGTPYVAPELDEAARTYWATRAKQTKVRPGARDEVRPVDIARLAGQAVEWAV